jgi:hypothetical protein
MEWQANWEGPLQSYLQRFDGLLGDARTRRTFQASIQGIMTAGTLICQRIAACSALLAHVKDGGQRILRLATGESTKRSQVDAEHLTAQLREVAVEQLAQAPEDELWLIADGSDLRKPYAEAMPALMQVRALRGPVGTGLSHAECAGPHAWAPGHPVSSTRESVRKQALEVEPAEVQQA